MDPKDTTRKRPGQPAKPPARLSREKKRQQDAEKSRTTRESKQSSKGAARSSGSEKANADEDVSARSFTVGNVGRNGTLYLSPSQAPPAPVAKPSTAPPNAILEKRAANAKGAPRREPESRMSHTPRPAVMPGGGRGFNAAAPSLPLIEVGESEGRRTRSHSFSTVDDSRRAPVASPSMYGALWGDQQSRQRARSSLDLSGGLQDLRIPHYKLGTPRFSEMGTPWLHQSRASSIANRSVAGDMRSSHASRSDFDRFPAPPGTGHSRNASNEFRSYASYLRGGPPPSSDRTTTPTTPRIGSGITVALYDHVEANINSPSLVRYSASTGRIMAATPARLIAQITSPWFLDYELLSDFFLSYRNFLPRCDMLNYLMARMQWALANESDSGRIVTVRTFVALRHWILNYFADDFLTDPDLRQQLCDLVNDIADTLRERADGGGGGMKVVGELKKCWRRVCAMFWSVEDLAEDLAEDEPDADIVPGAHDQSSKVRASATSMLQSGARDSMYLDFRRSSYIPLSTLDGAAYRESIVANGAQQSQVAVVPLSPESSHSLQVLSCSVPFLKNVAPAKERSATSRSHGSSEKSTQAAQRAHRSVSFSDALRDNNTPPSPAPSEDVDFRSLPHMSFTGGLIRGLLLQPTPSRVDLRIPISPPITAQDFDFGFDSPRRARSTYDSQQSSAGVKKLVGDVRRALSSRKRDSPISQRSTSSSESRHSNHSGQQSRDDRPPSWQQLQGPRRIDALGDRVVSTYGEALNGLSDRDFTSPLSGRLDIYRGSPRTGAELSYARDAHRMNTGSHVTTGSRSILIVDDTWLPGVPIASGGGTSLASQSPSIGPVPRPWMSEEAWRGHPNQVTRKSNDALPTSVGKDVAHGSLHQPIYDLLAEPEFWQGGIAISDDRFGIGEARKSSSAHPPDLDSPPIRQQLRRRPGGDLKIADHVHQLQYARAGTADSTSAFSQAIFTSGVPSIESMHPAGRSGSSKDDFTLLSTHSSQPNMRASMKAQVSHLAKLPDDESDGGVEDTLAKLEGKDASPTASTHGLVDHDTDSGIQASSRRSVRGPSNGANLSESAYGSLSTSGVRSMQTDRQGASILRMSDDSYSGSVAAATANAERMSTASGATLRREVPVQGLKSATRHEVPARVGSVNATISSATARGQPTMQDSFLMEDEETASDISSDMDDEQNGEADVDVRSLYFDDTARKSNGRKAHFKAQPTMPSNRPASSAQSADSSQAHRRTISEPQQSLRGAASASTVNNAASRASKHLSVDPSRISITPDQNGNAHLPFLLAYESDVIAEQMTIIEKDALDEIDWKDLIALNWQHAPLHIRNWVDFLQRNDCNGIDIVVSRFNLVVKWVISECILTELPIERARCITKYIHVAAHAHRLRNYASMYQITLALLSSDLARLQKTWALVPATERQLLQRLEKLCNPRGNFHHLRTEIESASVDDPCIPFIGLYTHDLMFNAQKPSRVESTLSRGEPLVNFERFQTAASLVKGLLTLIEASGKYVFRPHPELLSRCLWLAALEDEEISARSKSLEI